MSTVSDAWQRQANLTKARSRALARLARRYPTDYLVLFDEELANVSGADPRSPDAAPVGRDRRGTPTTTGEPTT